MAEKRTEKEVAEKMREKGWVRKLGSEIVIEKE